MAENDILSLEVQRMPKDPKIEFGHPADAPVEIFFVLIFELVFFGKKKDNLFTFNVNLVHVCCYSFFA